MATPLKGALIGCGFVSRFHLEGWARVGDAEIVALCETDPTRLEASGSRAPNARLYRDAAAMFVENRFDFVEICTGPESHLSLVSLAARNGAHVLCQKPASTTRPDLDAMIAVCDGAGVRLMIHENWRFRSWYRALRDEIRAGTVGRPIRLRLSHRDTRALRADGFADQPFLATRPHLILLEMGCHLVDSARFLLGEIVDVSASLGRFGEGHPGEDVATLSVTFADGPLGLLDMTWCAPAEVARAEWALNETVIEGTAGTLRLQTDGSLLFVKPDGTSEPRHVAMPPDDEVYVDAYRATQAHFINGLRTGSPHETSGRDTLKTMDVVWGGYRSAQEGRRIGLQASDT